MGLVGRLVRGFFALCLLGAIIYVIGTTAHSLLTRGDLTEFLDHRLTADQFFQRMLGG
jgi:hypothetical protein